MTLVEIPLSVGYKASLIESPLTLVRGKRRKDTVLICLSQDDIEEGKIAMNKGELQLSRIGWTLNNAVARGNCAIKLGDLVHVSPANDIKYGKR